MCTSEIENTNDLLTVGCGKSLTTIVLLVMSGSLIPRPPLPAFVACNTKGFSYCKGQKLGVEAWERSYMSSPHACSKSITSSILASYILLGKFAKSLI